MTNRPAYWDTLTEDERGDYDAYDPFKEKGNGKAWTKPKIGEEHGLVIVRAADVTPVAVDWIWEGRIARGKLTIVAGAPDVGKSQIGAYIAARITNGQHWPKARWHRKAMSSYWHRKIALKILGCRD